MSNKPKIDTKILSQNFLVNKAVVRTVVNKSNITNEDTVYEIGPGDGIITEVLAEKAKKVVAVEIDTTLTKNLREKFFGKNVDIINMDFNSFKLPKEKYKLFSNIPFSITSQIIRKLTHSTNSPEEIYLIVQAEAAKRYAGVPYFRESLVSLLIKPFFKAEIIHDFDKFNFLPVPGVKVVLLNLKKLKNPMINQDDRKIYEEFIKYSFQKYSFNLKNKLKDIFSHEQFKRLSKDYGFKLDAYPTDLTFDQWLGLFNYYMNGVSDEKKHKLHFKFKI